MKAIRIALSTGVILALALGYGASQLAFFNGTWAEYSAKVDVPAIRYLALAVLILAVVFAFLPERSEGEQG
jgi:hypothetical protein